MVLPFNDSELFEQGRAADGNIPKLLGYFSSTVGPCLLHNPRPITTK